MDGAIITEFASREGLALGVVASVFLAGLQHGFDIDHVSAISDITTAQPDRRRSLVLASAYGLGHMLVLLALGIAAMFLGERISGSIDSIARQVIGLTLLALGLYVVYSLLRFRSAFRMRSRWMLVLTGARRLLHRMRPRAPVVIEHAHEHAPQGHHNHLHEHESLCPTASAKDPLAVATATNAHAHTHKHVGLMPIDPSTEYGLKTSFLVGMIHGVGAETPTQIMLFTTAAGVAGTFAGAALLAAFVFGLLVGNSLLAVVTTAGFAAGKKFPVLYMGMAATTALVSIYVGAAYLLQRPSLLPWLLGR